jgi:hypothetical protein
MRQGSNKRPCAGILTETPKSELYAPRLLDTESENPEFQHAFEFTYFFEIHSIRAHEV